MVIFTCSVNRKEKDSLVSMSSMWRTRPKTFLHVVESDVLDAEEQGMANVVVIVNDYRDVDLYSF